jgi:hypothetical protein
MLQKKHSIVHVEEPPTKKQKREEKSLDARTCLNQYLLSDITLIVQLYMSTSRYTNEPELSIMTIYPDQTFCKFKHNEWNIERVNNDMWNNQMQMKLFIKTNTFSFVYDSENLKKSSIQHCIVSLPNLSPEFDSKKKTFFKRIEEIKEFENLTRIDIDGAGKALDIFLSVIPETVFEMQTSFLELERFSMQQNRLVQIKILYLEHVHIEYLSNTEFLTFLSKFPNLVTLHIQHFSFERTQYNITYIDDFWSDFFTKINTILPNIESVLINFGFTLSYSRLKIPRIYPTLRHISIYRNFDIEKNPDEQFDDEQFDEEQPDDEDEENKEDDEDEEDEDEKEEKDENEEKKEKRKKELIYDDDKNNMTFIACIEPFSFKSNLSSVSHIEQYFGHEKVQTFFF